MLRFHKGYFVATVVLFSTEVFIALFLHDDFIRPYLGDVLVVILIYCFVKIFFDFKVVPLALSVLLFAFVVEFAQYFKFINILGMKHSKVAQAVLGTSFSWLDMVTYIVGIALVIIVEKIRTKPSLLNHRDTSRH